MTIITVTIDTEKQRVVPVEPTAAMIDPARSQSSFPAGIYRAMLSAAPACPQADEVTPRPRAWMVPKLIDIPMDYSTGIARGIVAWSPSLIGDEPPVTDKSGVTHAPIPLFERPPSDAADALPDEALACLVNFCIDDSGHGAAPIVAAWLVKHHPGWLESFPELRQIAIRAGGGE